MKKPVSQPKDQKAQNTVCKPTAQELYQQAGKQPPAVNPTNVADNSSVADTPLNSPAGYSNPDSPDESDAEAVRNDLSRPGRADGGDDEKDPNPNPVKDNPRM